MTPRSRFDADPEAEATMEALRRRYQQQPPRSHFRWLMLIRLFQQTPRGSVIGWLARRFPKPCANFSRTSPPKRLVESTWPPAAGRLVLCVLDAGTGVLMNWCN